MARAEQGANRPGVLYGAVEVRKGGAMKELQKRYPKWVECRNQLSVEIRPLSLEHVGKHMAFLRSLDDSDLARLPADVLDPDYPDKVRCQIRTRSVHRLVAWYGLEEIVGSLTLYPGTTPWVRHTANVVMVTRPEYRRFGLATVLCDEMIPFAESLGIRKVYAHLSDMHSEATRLVRAIGFHREGRLEQHIRDRSGNFHPMYIYGMNLVDLQQALIVRMAQFVRLEHKA